MAFQEKLQGALKTLETSLEQHEVQRKGYDRTIARLTELSKSVPPESKVFNSPNVC